MATISTRPLGSHCGVTLRSGGKRWSVVEHVGGYFSSITSWGKGHEHYENNKKPPQLLQSHPSLSVIGSSVNPFLSSGTASHLLLSSSSSLSSYFLRTSSSVYAELGMLKHGSSEPFRSSLLTIGAYPMVMEKLSEIDESLWLPNDASDWVEEDDDDDEEDENESERSWVPSSVSTFLQALVPIDISAAFGPLWLSSTLKKRRKKMNKHKRKKRRKKLRRSTKKR